MSNPLKRIKTYIDFKGITISVFEKSAGLSNGSFGGQLKKNKTIGVDKLENIQKRYPDLNANWVLTGKGNMLTEEVPAKPQDSSDPDSATIAILERNYERTIESLNKVIAAQQKTIAALERLVEHKE